MKDRETIATLKKVLNSYENTGKYPCFLLDTEQTAAALRDAISRLEAQEVIEEYAIATVTNSKVFPKIFKTETAANIYRAERADPGHWKVVVRTVSYSDWRD